ncbi:MAG: hypothetical protein HYX69_05370 [Planctomycetia bacterium]|nr:hypothetical protein [Planctomycetia bacterium]
MKSSFPYCWLPLALVAVAMTPTGATACPFCSAVSMTLAEELKASDAAVIARLVDRPPVADPSGATGAPAKSTFEIVKVLKGDKLLAGKKKIEILFFGTQEPGTQFLLYGVDPKDLAWGTPTAMTDRGIEYMEKIATLADAPAERLAFFQEYLEDEDPLLSGDAYSEFAKAPYADVALLKGRMHHDRLLRWVQDAKVSPSRRGLYFTMIGICGEPEDVPMLEELIRNDDRQTRTALNAMIAAYLTLKGPDGMPLVEDLFLKNDKSEYLDTYSAIVALRFLGQETTIVPKERLVEALKHMLDRPQLADLVISDLARWQDWSAMDKLVALFKNANEESSWVRVPVVQYLRACPDPKAKEYIDELAKIDPDAVKRANSFFPLVGGPGAPPTATAATPPAQDTQAAAAGSGPGAPSEVFQQAVPQKAQTVGAVDPKPDQKVEDGQKAEEKPAAAVAKESASPPSAGGELKWTVLGTLAAAALVLATYTIAARGKRAAPVR